VRIQQLRKTTDLNSPAEAVEGTERNVLFVSSSFCSALKSLTGCLNHALKVAVPEMLDGGLVTVAQTLNPASDFSGKVVCGHGVRSGRQVGCGSRDWGHGREQAEQPVVVKNFFWNSCRRSIAFDEPLSVGAEMLLFETDNNA